MKNEIFALKEKLNEHFEIKEEETNDLKEKLAHLHTVDINDLKDKHDEYVGMALFLGRRGIYLSF